MPQGDLNAGKGMTRQARHPALIAPPKPLQAPILNSSVPRDAHLRAKSALKIFHAVTVPSHSAPNKTQCIVEDVKSALKPTNSAMTRLERRFQKQTIESISFINPLSRHRHPKTMSGRPTTEEISHLVSKPLQHPPNPPTHSLTHATAGVES